MKNILKVSLIIAAIIAAYTIGHSHGFNHLLTNGEFYITAYNDKCTFDGHNYDTRLYIDIDGQTYEQGLYIG